MPKSANKKSSDPFDKFIFEKGLRATQVVINKKFNLLVIILNNGKVLRIFLSDYKKLQKASQSQLDKWKLTGDGIGIQWTEIDEDLSLKGMIKTAAMSAALHSMESKGDFGTIS